MYVLLRPQSKKKTAPVPQAPGHLRDLVIPVVPPEDCAWSLSGPQFPVTNKAGTLQQRYCYPKGRPAYSSYKGGALWTIRGEDGKEDNEYRLLHVYQSQKRAANKGVTLEHRSTPASCDYTYYQPIPKKPRYISPSRERVLPTRDKIPSTSIHRINSCATLETTLSFPTLDHGFSHSFESIQVNQNARDASPDQLSSHCSTDNQTDPSMHHPSQRQEPTHHDFTFHDLNNDPLLQEMEQRSNQAKFSQRLDVVHDMIRKYIYKQPEHLQAGLTYQFANWARATAMDPLWTRPKVGTDETYRDAFGPSYGNHGCC